MLYHYAINHGSSNAFLSRKQCFITNITAGSWSVGTWSEWMRPTAALYMFWRYRCSEWPINMAVLCLEHWNSRFLSMFCWWCLFWHVWTTRQTLKSCPFWQLSSHVMNKMASLTSRFWKYNYNHQPGVKRPNQPGGDMRWLTFLLSGLFIAVFISDYMHSSPTKLGAITCYYRCTSNRLSLTTSQNKRPTSPL